MSVDISIHGEACRGCRMCVDVCPTKVLAFDDASLRATVSDAASCIACLSCTYLCPSGAISQRNYHAVMNFYRDLGFSRRMERFL